MESLHVAFSQEFIDMLSPSFQTKKKPKKYAKIKVSQEKEEKG